MQALNDDHTLALSLPIKELKALLLASEVAYYNETDEAEDILDDQVYDYAKEVCRVRQMVDGTYVEPKSCLDHVPASSSRMVELPTHLGSTDKVNHGTGELDFWLGKFPSQKKTISAKLDGASALYNNHFGKYTLYSRGDKKEGKGQNITAMLEYLNLPEIPEGTMVRGELIIPKSAFEARHKRIEPDDKTKYRNSRNAVAGLVNRFGAAATKQTDVKLSDRAAELIHDVQFVVYEYITEEPMRSSEQFEFLETTFTGCVADHIVTDEHDAIDDDTLSELYDMFSEHDYEIDGLVVCDDGVYERPEKGNPEYLVAYKKALAVLTSITTVLSIEWNVSKDAYIKPVIIMEPILLDGVTIQRASGYNAKNIVDNCVGPGSVIEVTRAGGVIPKVIRFIEPCREVQMPDFAYKWNETNVDIVATEMEDEIQIKKLAHFLSKAGAKGVGEKSVAKMYHAGIDDFMLFFVLEVDDLTDIFGPKQSQNIVTAIKGAISRMDLPLLAATCDCFGRLLGETRFRLIFDTYPNILEMDIVQNNDVREIRKLIQSIDGFADITAKSVAAGFESFLQMLRDLEEIGYVPPAYEVEEESSVDEDHELSGQKVLLTGFRDKDIVAFLKGVGATVQKNISNQTDILIIKTDGYTNNKTSTAEKNGTLVVSKDDFARQYM